MRHRRCWGLGVAISAVGLWLCPSVAWAGLVRLEGFYEFRTDINQENGAFSPNVEADGSSARGAKNYFQGRIYADPTPGVNLYTKLELDSKSDDKYRFAEGHMYLRKEVNKKGFEWILFDSEERFFMNDPLLEITQGKSDLRGMRSNLWAWNGWVNFYAGKLKQDGGVDDNNDAYAMRMGRNFFPKNRLTIAGTASSKVWSAGRNSVGGLDLTWRFGEAELVAAGATSHTSGITRADATIFQSELRNFRLSSRRLGSLRMTSAFRNVGSGYRNYLGKNPEKQEDGIYNEVSYEVPFKSMRLTWKSDIKKERRLNIFVNPKRRSKYWYGELFSEFRRGYKAKIFYETSNDPWAGNIRYDAWFYQIESYSKFNTLKAQIKWRNFNNRYEQSLFGVENSHNLIADKLYLMIRILHSFTEERQLGRTSLFTQLRYKVKDNGNVFLEFGNNDHGNDDLANDGSFAGNSDVNTDRIVKLMLQLWW